MKINMPVTMTERYLEPGKPIVTKTDLKGRITYANDSFVRISGFTRDELIGSSHNIVRHPDMPPEAFDDLWRCLKAQLPWRGLVKNRSKEGDFYWVDAFVTPITQDGERKGYISVRSTPSRAQIQQAESLYRDIREKRASFLATKHPSSKGWFAKNLFAPASVAAASAIAGAMMPGALGVAFAMLAVLVSLGLPFWVRHTVYAPVREVRRVLQAIDEGKLNEGIEARSGPLAELQLQLETLRIHLKAMFCDVMVGADQVERRAGGLSSDMHRAVESTNRQSDEISEAAAAIEEMSVSVTEISNNTSLSLRAVTDTENLAIQGKSVVDHEIETSRNLVDAVKASQTQISRVNASINEISDIARLINEIADQTNLLALNAAIEAARAGEHGRGFAVVADEVRKLAERTATSTRSIAGTIDAIRNDADAAVQAMDRVVSDVESNTSEIQGTGQSLNRIVEAGSLLGRFGPCRARHAETTNYCLASDCINDGAHLGESGRQQICDRRHRRSLRITAAYLQRVAQLGRAHAISARLIRSTPMIRNADWCKPNRHFLKEQTFKALERSQGIKAQSVPNLSTSLA